jgi:hypothetical protein
LPLARLGAQDDETLAKAAAVKAAERRAELQKKLAAGSDVQKQLRLDGFAAVEGRVRVIGLFLEPLAKEGTDPKPKPPFEAIQDDLRELVKDAIKDVTKGKPVLFDFTTLTRFERDDPLFARLQKTVAERPALDGVRVDTGAKFGPGGELLLAGIRPKLTDAKDRAALEKGMTECYQSVLKELTAAGDASAERYKKFAAGPGVSVAAMAEADTRKILAQLREWAKASKDDVRFARLYFGPDGGLKLLCEAPTDSDIDDVRGKLKEFAPEYYPPAPKSDAPPKANKPGPVVAGTTVPAFTPFLQKQLADDPKKRWAAVLIERGYFDENNRFTLRGVVDRAEQKTELAELVASFARDARWKPYFAPAGAKVEGVNFALDAIPMEELVARVQRVVRAYPVFDGIAVAGAKYDADANLVFTAQVVGKRNLDDARLTLAGLIAKHPDYSRRLGKAANAREPKLRVESLAAVGADDELAKNSIALAAEALKKEDMPKAKKWIDTGLLHSPQESSIWFLSAYYNHLQGDKELVRRDLFRMIAAEGEIDPLKKNRRYQVASDLQGEKRGELEKLSQDCWKEAKEGVKPITLVPEKLAK